MARVVLAAALFLFVAACSDDTLAPTVDLPEPVPVTAEDVPGPGDGVFYYIHWSPMTDPGPVLREAIRGGVGLTAAWQPRSESPCEAPTATTALVLRAHGPVERLSAQGFASDPGPWIVNCGVEGFWKYDFEGTARRQDFLFEIGYENHAWGLQINGLYVDRKGRVFHYNHNHADWQPGDPDAVTAGELREKYANREPVGTVDLGTLNTMSALIAAASRGAFSEPVSVCADAGGTAFRAYTYDAATDVYHPVLLYAAGDVARKNLSDSAETIYTWLFTIGGRPDGCLP